MIQAPIELYINEKEFGIGSQTGMASVKRRHFHDLRYVREDKYDEVSAQVMFWLKKFEDLLSANKIPSTKSDFIKSYLLKLDLRTIPLAELDIIIDVAGEVWNKLQYVEQEEKKNGRF